MRRLATAPCTCIKANMTAPFETIPGAADADVLFICDHASNHVPSKYGNLGLPAHQFERHIAYDIGAAAATRRLAAMFQAPAILAGFSRLLIDANRGADDPTLVMQLSDGAIIPGNADIDEAETERRRENFWRPYRDAAAGMLDAMLARGRAPAIVSLHSFTPVMKGIARPWEIAVLWDSDSRIAAPLIENLRADGVIVGDNEPYDGALEGDTLHELGTSRGVPHVLVEFRQDLVSDEAGITAWTNRLATALTPVLASPQAHMITHHESRTARPKRAS
jgi:predicted N-formylglutamate amidohydrolase